MSSPHKIDFLQSQQRIEGSSYVDVYEYLFRISNEHSTLVAVGVTGGSIDAIKEAGRSVEMIAREWVGRQLQTGWDPLAGTNRIDIPSDTVVYYLRNGSF